MVIRLIVPVQPRQPYHNLLEIQFAMQSNERQGDEDLDSSDEAFLEMLGLTSLDIIMKDDDEVCIKKNILQTIDAIPTISRDRMQSIIDAEQLACIYVKDSICILPKTFSVPAPWMRRLTDELVWGNRHADRTFEPIQVLLKDGSMEKRKALTRLENFVSHHDEWNTLCRGYLARCVSALLQEEMVLYKEKLNLKPPGGVGFAPHLDTPSLRIALGERGPQTFVTAMIAIDDMTPINGCLRVVKGTWTQDNHCEVMEPEQDGNPDAGGRAGAILSTKNLEFEDITCQGGDIVIFTGWTPHRSSANLSAFPRRAVFLTYNPKKEGDCHDLYYQQMEDIRNEWRACVGMGGSGLSIDKQRELDALRTIPTI